MVRDRAAALTMRALFPFINIVLSCGLAPTAVLPALLPRFIRTGQPPSMVACLLLGQIATDQELRGKGIASCLLKHAMQRCIVVARQTGGRALIVNAVDAQGVPIGCGISIRNEPFRCRKASFLLVRLSDLLCFLPSARPSSSMPAGRRFSLRNGRAALPARG